MVAQQVQQVLPLASDVALGAEPDESVAPVARVGVVRVDPGLVGEPRMERDAEQPHLVHARVDVDGRERLAQQSPVPDQADLPEVLVRDEHRPVRGHRHVHGEVQAPHDGLEPLLGADRRGEQKRQDEERAEASGHRLRV